MTLKRYGMDCQGREWNGVAESIFDAIEQAERDTGRTVVRGRCLEGYTAPDKSQMDRQKEFFAMMRQLNAEAAGWYDSQPEVKTRPKRR